jgi:hypothetical protein
MERYEGDLVDNKFHGHGSFFYANGDVYIGSWLNNKRSGSGILIFTNGDKFEGEFLNDLPNGKGAYFNKQTGQQTERIYVNGNLTG